MIFLNEIYKGLMLLWDYKFNLLMESLIIVFVFIGVNFLVGNGGADAGALSLSASLLGYIIWVYTTMAISNMGWSLQEEARTGTLEQMVMSPVSPQVLILGRAVANLLTTTITILLVGGVLVPLLQIDFTFTFAGAIVLLWTLVGILGLGLMVAGMTLIFKQVDSFGYFLQYSLIFLNGSIVPIERFPDWLAFLATLLPGTQGIIVLRQVLIDGSTLADVWASGVYIALIVHSCVYFALGWVFFGFCERYARRKGTLGQY